MQIEGLECGRRVAVVVLVVLAVAVTVVVAVTRLGCEVVRCGRREQVLIVLLLLLLLLLLFVDVSVIGWWAGLDFDWLACVG